MSDKATSPSHQEAGRLPGRQHRSRSGASARTLHNAHFTAHMATFLPLWQYQRAERQQAHQVMTSGTIERTTPHASNLLSPTSINPGGKQGAQIRQDSRDTLLDHFWRRDLEVGILAQIKRVESDQLAHFGGQTPELVVFQAQQFQMDQLAHFGGQASELVFVKIKLLQENKLTYFGRQAAQVVPTQIKLLQG